ncbi:MAG TPA: DNA-binding domain-containing protein [Opitutaceae bacterium]
MKSRDAELQRVQRAMFAALLRPLGPDDRLSSSAVRAAEKVIKPNARLTAAERLEIYARSYWYRLIDCVYDDCPGLRALLGDARFDRLVRAYLAQRPSRSFTLRNLCSRLPDFIRARPALTAPHTALALAVARFEWAQTVAFDGEARPRLSAAAIARTPPEELRIGLQPYLSLLALDWPVDDYVLAVKRREALRGSASNAVEGATSAESLPRVRRPRRGRVYLVVHRHDRTLYYKRVPVTAFRILSRLQRGGTLAQALAGAGRGATGAQVRSWFASWMALGWFCARK